MGLRRSAASCAVEMLLPAASLVAGAVLVKSGSGGERTSPIPRRSGRVPWLEMAHTVRCRRDPALGVRHARATLAIVALTVCVGACGSSSKPASVAPTTSTKIVPSSVPTPAGSTTAATGGATAAPVAVCTTFPFAEVAPLSGIALTSSREQDAAPLNSYTCDYFTASGSGGISVTVITVGGATSYANSLQNDTIAETENVAPLSGLGDKAFSAHDGVRALFGDRLIYVAGLTTVAPAEAVVNALQAKLA
jgi:hypothetical protein